MSSIAAVILAAGKGTRMRSTLPKVLHPVAGRPMVRHVLDAVAALAPERTVVVVGPGMEAVADAVAPAAVAVQAEQRGTADAVKAARAELDGFDGTVLVLFGDSPLIRTETMRALIDARTAGSPAAGLAVLGFEPEDPTPYGRLVLDADGGLVRIVEAPDAGPEELRIGLCNSGVMAIDGARLFAWLDAVGCDNAKGEFYLPDIVGLARADGAKCAVVRADAEEPMGINSRADLAAAEAAMQARLRGAAMDAGVTLRDPASVWLSADTEFGQDVTVGPSVVFGPGVRVGDGAVIEAFCHLEGAAVDAGARVGPFARLRPGTELGAGARIGNFVEVKNASLGPGAKANHLAYVGDAAVGADANIGAGTITCNYDGFAKHHTEIGAGAFIGSNSALVAPVTIGAGAVVGAGSTIAKDVEADALAVERSEQRVRFGWAERQRARRAPDSGKG